MYIPIKDLLNFIEEYIDGKSSEKVNRDVKIKYPNKKYHYVELKFNSPLNNYQYERLLPILEYWGNIPYVGGVALPYKWKNYPQVSFQCEEENSASSDPRKYKPLEQLADWIQNGTPVRSTMGNTRAHEGLGNILLEVEAV